ncbi:hypothetical protein [Rhizobium laguerreae]|uniref:hypothetical protein n=1 Tax=Rhizobium laguerreae TaxID=1076926 RepID=UPI00103E1D59|nr:hypothetical protein [Rhizobium laguerreae]MBY3091727.1 hypothetical protein [Rhizobium laguerreae]MBY3312566.1 hypothetical protein [Rhizobium laguerreae]TBY10262.1 hypothetical protein E0J21_08375 [Rhizobium laguerreae]
MILWLRLRPDRNILQKVHDGTDFYNGRNVNVGSSRLGPTVHAAFARLAFEQLTAVLRVISPRAGPDKRLQAVQEPRATIALTMSCDRFELKCCGTKNHVGQASTDGDHLNPLYSDGFAHD